MCFSHIEFNRILQGEFNFILLVGSALNWFYNIVSFVKKKKKKQIFFRTSYSDYKYN